MDTQVRVLQKGKITIPIEVRRSLGIREGDVLSLEVRGGKLVLSPPSTVPNPTELLSGLAEGVAVAGPAKGALREGAATRLEEKVSRSSE